MDSSLLAGLDNPVEDNLVLVEHIEGLLVPYKLVLVDQALWFDKINQIDFVISFVLLYQSVKSDIHVRKASPFSPNKPRLGS